MRLKATVSQIVASKNDTEAARLVLDGLALGLAKWQVVEIVGFLWVVVRPDFVQPHSNLFSLSILSTRRKKKEMTQGGYVSADENTMDSVSPCAISHLRGKL